MKIFILALSLGSIVTFSLDIVLLCLLVAAFIFTTIEVDKTDKLKAIDYL